MSATMKISGVIRSDPTLLRVVFQNLLTNAAKYTPQGGTIGLVLMRDTGKLIFGTQRPPNSILITVSDTGCGIPAEAQPRIFSKLYRAENAQKIDKEGTGLGLYIVKKIVERLGGTIWFQSEINKGTTFCVALSAHGLQ